MKNLDFDFDEKAGVFIKREEIQLNNVRGVAEIRDALKIELAGIIRQVKTLKRRAEEIKKMLDVLDKKAGPTDPAPASEESQSPPAVAPGSM